MLDQRLLTVKNLYDRCELAADIGTDHGLLPAEILEEGVCQRMILTDISPAALSNSRKELSRRGLLDRADFRTGFGLDPIIEKCGVISITGMGGRTIHDIIVKGYSALAGAVLVLSAHSDLPLLRTAVQRAGYYPETEEVCFCAGRFYTVLRAVPGLWQPDGREIRLGGAIFQSASPVLLPYIDRQISILNARHKGLLKSCFIDHASVAEAASDIEYLEERKKEITARRKNRNESH